MIINDRISKMKDNYNEDHAYFFSCREMFRWLYQKGILKEISFLFSEKENSIYFAFDTDDLLPYRDQMESAKVRDCSIACSRIFGDEGYQTDPSFYSGAVSLTWTMLDYRNIGGCVTRSWGLLDEKTLTNESLGIITAIQKMHGTKAAVEAIWDLYDDGKLSYEISIDEDYAEKQCEDLWEAACAWHKDGLGVDYNFCKDSGKDQSAIYLMRYNKDTEDMDIDTETFEPYEIDFSNEEWTEELVTKMYLFLLQHVYNLSCKEDTLC